MIHIGIDPGVNGGCAAFENDQLIDTYANTGVEYEDIVSASKWLETYNVNDTIVVIEQVTGYIATGKNNQQQDSARQPASKMFQMGRSYGAWMGICATHGYTLDQNIYKVVPRTWQKGIGLERNGMAYAKWKSFLNKLAKDLVPGYKVTLKSADAVLIALYGKMVY